MGDQRGVDGGDQSGVQDGGGDGPGAEDNAVTLRLRLGENRPLRHCGDCGGEAGGEGGGCQLCRRQLRQRGQLQ